MDRFEDRGMGEEEGGGGRGKCGSSSLNRIGLEKIFLVAVPGLFRRVRRGPTLRMATESQFRDRKLRKW